MTTLIFADVLLCEEMKESGSIVPTIALNILALVKFFFVKYLDKLAADESFVFHFYEGMTAYVNWLPHLSKI